LKKRRDKRGGEAMTFNSVSHSDQRLLADLEQGMEAASPAMAFQLMMQRQALQDRISFQNWIEASKLMAEQVEEDNVRNVAAAQLGRRASLRLGSF
jgi:hypothetical protein